MTYRPYQFADVLREVPRYIPIASVNHDFVPTEEGGMPKVWWVDLTSPAPHQLKIGMETIVRVSDMTSLFLKEALRDKLFKVGDIMGTRVMLVSADVSHTSRQASLHKEIGYYMGSSSGFPSFKKSPFGWGVHTTYPTAPFKRDQFQIKYGVGPPVGFLEML